MQSTDDAVLFPVPILFFSDVQARAMHLAEAIPYDQPVPLRTVAPLIALRVMGPAGAGFPSPAQDWEESAIDLVALLRLDRPDCFIFRISGSSMIDAGLYDGDVVVVDRGTKPTNGRLVIAVVDGGFVVRQLCIRAAGGRLEGRNAGAGSPPIPLNEDVEIWGVVRACVRNLQG